MSTSEDRRADAIEWARDLRLGPDWDKREPWMADCPHDSICETEAECYRRHLSCECVQAHETEVECRQWQLENPDDDARLGLHGVGRLPVGLLRADVHVV